MELWGRCPVCMEWFFIADPEATIDFLCPNCQAAAYRYEHRPVPEDEESAGGDVA